MTPSPTPLTLAHCQALDAADPLAGLRQQFLLPEGRIYLDGNSLGVLPRATPARVQQVVADEWGHGLIASWNTAGWMAQPQAVGDKIGRLLGAAPGEVVACDSTSLNLYKALAVALQFVLADHPSAPAGAGHPRRVILSERDNFPTDLYIAESLAAQHGFTLKLVDGADIPAHIDDTLAVLMLTHVHYRSGRMHDMAAVNRAAHAAGALVLWDLAHSAGAVPVALHGDTDADDAADFAVGCGYKYLNGGPGAPAFVWLHPRHTARMDAQGLWQPLSGWLGHAAPFAFSPQYRPAGGMARFIVGTPSPMGLAALDCGVDTLLAAGAHGGDGMAALRAKSLALTDLFIALVEQRCAGHGLQLATPREHAVRGSQVSWYRDEGAYAIVQALIARGVVGDYREPGILRFGFTPAYTSFAEVWQAVEHLRQVLDSGEWREARFHQRSAVT